MQKSVYIPDELGERLEKFEEFLDHWSETDEYIPSSKEFFNYSKLFQLAIRKELVRAELMLTEEELGEGNLLDDDDQAKTFYSYEKGKEWASIWLDSIGTGLLQKELEEYQARINDPELEDWVSRLSDQHKKELDCIFGQYLFDRLDRSAWARGFIKTIVAEGE